MSVQRPYFDRGVADLAEVRELLGGGQGLVERRDLDHVVPAEGFLGLGVRAVGEQEAALAVLAYDGRRRRWLEMTGLDDDVLVFASEGGVAVVEGLALSGARGLVVRLVVVDEQQIPCHGSSFP